MLKSLKYLFIYVLILFFGCGDSASDGRELTTHPGYEYMPNMYRSSSYETYSENSLFKNNSTALNPVTGTIPRGFMPFEYDNSLEDYLRAGKELQNPLHNNVNNIEEGEVLYEMFCAHCHGKKGDGQGSVKHPLYGAVPSYSDNVLIRRSGTTMENLLDGHMYHAITYGFNAMGPHASQISAEERWKIIMYVNELQKENK
jgi:mono/diheme cytochrome c family protein